MCLYKLFSKHHNYFSTKSPNLQYLQCDLDEADHFSVTRLPLCVLSLKSACPQLFIFEPPCPASYCTPINTLVTINGLHSYVNLNWTNFFRVWEFNNSKLFEPNVWKLFHFDVQWVRNVRICVFKVKYDGREIPRDYTEPVLSRYV